MVAGNRPAAITDPKRRTQYNEQDEERTPFHCAFLVEPRPPRLHRESPGGTSVRQRLYRSSCSTVLKPDDRLLNRQNRPKIRVYKKALFCIRMVAFLTKFTYVISVRQRLYRFQRCKKSIRCLLTPHRYKKTVVMTVFLCLSLANFPRYDQ